MKICTDIATPIRGSLMKKEHVQSLLKDKEKSKEWKGSTKRKREARPKPRLPPLTDEAGQIAIVSGESLAASSSEAGITASSGIGS